MAPFSTQNAATLFLASALAVASMHQHMQGQPITCEPNSNDLPGPPPQHGLELQRRAEICVSQRNIRVAEALQVKAVALLRSSPPATGLELANALGLLGAIYRYSGRLSKAESVIEEALPLFEAVPQGSDRAGLLRALHNLGTVLYLQRKYAKAERTFARAVSLWEKCCSNKPLSLAHLLNNVAAMNSRMRRYDRAVELSERSLALFEQALGPDQVMVAGTMGNLAYTHAARRDYRQAEELYQRAAGIWQRSGRTRDSGYASILGNYGVLLATLKRYGEAEKLHRQALSVLRLCCGEEHPDYPNRLVDHAHILRKLGRKEEAKSVVAHAASLQQSRPSQDGSSLTVDIEDLWHDR